MSEAISGRGATDRLPLLEDPPPTPWTHTQHTRPLYIIPYSHSVQGLHSSPLRGSTPDTLDGGSPAARRPGPPPTCRLQPRGPEPHPPRRPPAWRPNLVAFRGARKAAASPERGAPGLGLGGLGLYGVSAHTRSCRPMRRGRSRVGAERLEPMSSRIILHLRRLSVAVLAEGGWVDSVPLATRQGPARSHRRLRSVRHATRRPGVVGRCGAAQGRTRAVSACSTRATRPARSRQSARLCAAAQGQLHLTTCDRLGARRVGRAVQGGRTGRC